MKLFPQPCLRPSCSASALSRRRSLPRPGSLTGSGPRPQLLGCQPARPTIRLPSIRPPPIRHPPIRPPPPRPSTRDRRPSRPISPVQPSPISSRPSRPNRSTPPRTSSPRPPPSNSTRHPWRSSTLKKPVSSIRKLEDPHHPGGHLLPTQVINISAIRNARCSAGCTPPVRPTLGRPPAFSSKCFQPGTDRVDAVE